MAFAAAAAPGIFEVHWESYLLPSPPPRFRRNQWGALCDRLRPPPLANPAFTIELTLVDDLESRPLRAYRCWFIAASLFEGSAVAMSHVPA